MLFYICNIHNSGWREGARYDIYIYIYISIIIKIKRCTNVINKIEVEIHFFDKL